ncbi:MAG: hypothetical protein RSE18_00430 [Acinetobacter sp.]
MKTKLEMAHDYAVAMLRAGVTKESATEFAQTAFTLVDAMQAEAEKRSVYGANWDREKGSQKTFVNDAEQDHTWAGEEWQPDWSQAPTGYNYWVATADRDGKISGGWFYGAEPEFGESKGVSVYYSSNSNCILTESFGYTGDWRDSLRKRPN